MKSSVRPRIALVSMPMFAINYGSIQLGILKSVLLSHDYVVSDFYLNLPYAVSVGLGFYVNASENCHILLGEWLFASLAFADVDEKDDLAYLATARKDLENVFGNFIKKNSLSFDQLRDRLLIIKRQLTRKWLHEIAEQIPWQDFDVVGFSCTFSQTNASIALAKILKAKFPNIVIVFGGSSMDASMGREISSRCECIDTVVQGEGENAMLEVLSTVKKQLPLPRIFSSPVQTDLNNLPAPNYDTYYEFIRSHENCQLLEEKGEIGAISIETSRGCWWGQKNQCKFCGLNGTNIAYREKTPDTVIDELEFLSRKYNRYDFKAVDNILSGKFFKTLLPRLQEGKTSYRFFFEIKSNMTFEKMNLLSESGFVSLQPGIESLDSVVLKLMNKGSTTTQNLETLRWGRYFNMDILWNILYGFPGETIESYQRILSLIPKILHLQPPSACGQIRMDRFSPYFEDYWAHQHSPSSGKYTFLNIRPSPLYRYCYPKQWDIQQLAYHFLFDLPQTVPSEIYERLDAVVGDWKKRWATNKPDSRPKLTFKKALHHGHIIDARRGSTSVMEIDGAYFSLAKALERKPLTLLELSQAMGVDPDETQRLAAEFITEGIIVNPDGTYVWLPIPEVM